MADDVTATLRELAAHRGLKLVASRKRKPGGDFGKFGLTDLAGEPLLGIGTDGLTAAAEDIESYLRRGAENTWKASAKETAPRRIHPSAKSRQESHDETLPARRLAAPSPRPKRKRDPAPEIDADPARSGSGAPPTSGNRHPAKGDGTARAERPEKEEPVLKLRKAKPADVPALDLLLGQLAKSDSGGARTTDWLKAAVRGRAGVVIAEFDGLVGCCGWAIIPTLQYGDVGRLTIILVDERFRRRGIGRAMVDAARAALLKAGCETVEAMSDIDIKNAHNFFRSLGFEQTSYRFAAPTEVPATAT